MSPLFTRDEMRNILRARNVGEGMIKRVIAREFGDPDELAVMEAAADAGLAPAIGWPIKITLPWTALCSDNDKYAAGIRRNGTTSYPRLLLTEKYRGAKAKARDVATRMVLGMRPTTEPLAFIGRVYVPDNRPGHDVSNFAKCCLDAFEKVIYANDDQLHRVVWERAGVDVDAPRAEIEIRPL